jgi:hypothetical protein
VQAPALSALGPHKHSSYLAPVGEHESRSN